MDRELADLQRLAQWLQARHQAPEVRLFALSVAALPDLPTVEHILDTVTLGILALGSYRRRLASRG